MKATGIVRRIDDLGRIVIPKEIRKTLKINEGNPLEIYTDTDGNVIFKKYSPVGEMSDITNVYSKVISEQLSCTCFITDTDKVISVGGMSSKEILGKDLSEKMRSLILNRHMQICHDVFPFCEYSKKETQIIALIRTSGDILGSMILSDLDEQKEKYIDKHLQIITSLLSKQLE